MTNEELATCIKKGGNDELIPLLWEKVRAFVYMTAERYFRAHSTTCAAHGVDVWDIKQVGYIAFTEALKAFNPESGYKFLTYIRLPFRNAVNEVLGRRKKEDALNSAVSLDMPVNDEDGDGCTLIDLQADAQSTDFVDRLEAALASELIRTEVEMLPDREKIVIEMYYFDGKTLQEIGDLLGVSYQRAREIRAKAERMLRQEPELRKLYNEHYKERYIPRWKYYDWQPERYALSRTR